VFHRLARLAGASDPKNVQRNFRKKKRQDKAVTVKKVKERAEWLENTFLSHTVASIVLAVKQGVHPLDLKGSTSGALGFPQFLPGNYFNYGLDGDNDGLVDLFSPPDAIFSIANYLHAKGWNKSGLSYEEQQQVIWNYNHSAPYVETVLAMASLLEKDIEYLKKPAEKNS